MNVTRTRGRNSAPPTQRHLTAAMLAGVVLDRRRIERGLGPVARRGSARSRRHPQLRDRPARGLT